MMRKIDEPRHLCITDLFEMEEFQFFRANNLLTPCAFVHKKMLSGLGRNWEFPDPWGKISAGSGLNFAKVEPGFKLKVFFPKLWSGWASKPVPFVKGLFCCPHLVGTIPGGRGGVRDAGLEQETPLCPLWCTPSPLESHLIPGWVENQ